MKICPKCGAPADDDSIFCSECGCRIENDNSQQNSYTYGNDNIKTAPNTNKIFTLIPYALGFVGSIISILAAKDSDDVMFHVKEALKLNMVIVIVGILTALLAWTFIVPIAGGIFIIALFIAKIIAFVNACKGEMKKHRLFHHLSF